MTTLPPGEPELPYLGALVPLMLNTLPYARRHYARYGPVWRTTVLGVPTAVCIGADAQRQVLTDGERFVTSSGYDLLHPLFEGGILVLDGAAHHHVRQAMAPAFSGSHYATYVTQLQRIVTEELTPWGHAGETPVHATMLRILWRMSCLLNLGLDATDARFATLWHEFVIWQRGLYGLPPLDLPGTARHRAIAAVGRMRQHLAGLIAERRQTPRHDILSQLLTATQAGVPLTDEEICRQLVLTLFAGYETTAGAAAWMTLELLRHPTAAAPVLAELQTDQVGMPIQRADLKATPHFSAFFEETLRLHPLQHIIFRGVRQPWDFGGYTIPAGWKVVLVPLLTHRLATYFTDPDTFDPTRFLPPRDEGHQHPYAHVAFGGGEHLCLGAGIARLEVQVILTTLLRSYTLDLMPHQSFTPRFVPAGRPKDGVRVTYQRRASPRNPTVAVPTITSSAMGGAVTAS